MYNHDGQAKFPKKSKIAQVLSGAASRMERKFAKIPQLFAKNIRGAESLLAQCRIFFFAI